MRLYYDHTNSPNCAQHIEFTITLNLEFVHDSLFGSCLILSWVTQVLSLIWASDPNPVSLIGWTCTFSRNVHGEGQEGPECSGPSLDIKFRLV